jgi:hypothetical protein
MFYVFMGMFEIVALWAAGALSDLIFKTYNFGTFPGISFFLIVSLALVWGLFALATIHIFRLAIKHFKNRTPAVSVEPAAVPVAPTQETK